MESNGLLGCEETAVSISNKVLEPENQMPPQQAISPSCHFFFCTKYADFSVCSESKKLLFLAFQLAIQPPSFGVFKQRRIAASSFHPLQTLLVGVDS